MNNYLDKIVPITELRRNFGEITANLSEIDFLILTKGGEPFATLRAVPEEKMKVLKRAAGAWRKTSLDDDRVWTEVFKRKSRKKAISL